MRKIILIVLLAGATACTPTEAVRWWDVYQENPVGAVRFAKCVTSRPKAWDHPGAARYECRRLGRQAQREYNEAHAQWVPDTSCSQWAQTALDAGFSKDEWYEPVARIMWAESRCDPGAYNHVIGLMQIQPDWADDCGGSSSDLYNPWFNLHCAVYVKEVQGWNAWVTY